MSFFPIATIHANIILENVLIPTNVVEIIFAMSSIFLHPTNNAAFDDVEDRITRMGYHFVRILTSTLEYG